MRCLMVKGCNRQYPKIQTHIHHSLTQTSIALQHSSCLSSFACIRRMGRCCNDKPNANSARKAVLVPTLPYQSCSFLACFCETFSPSHRYAPFERFRVHMPAAAVQYAADQTTAIAPELSRSAHPIVRVKARSSYHLSWTTVGGLHFSRASSLQHICAYPNGRYRMCVSSYRLSAVQKRMCKPASNLGAPHLKCFTSASCQTALSIR